MKKKQHKKNTKYYIIKVVMFILLAILLIVLIKINYNDAQRKVALENTIADMTSLNAKQTFTIDKIYLYSSANATNNETKKSMWDLNIYQYTDIAIYISANSSNKEQNTIKELYIDNIKFDSLNTGTPIVYYKNLFEFGKFNLINDNIITERLNYQILPPVKTGINNEISNVVNSNLESSSLEQEVENTEASIVGIEKIDYSKPQIYSDCTTPITLEYSNLVKSNYLVSNIDSPLIYDGSLLKRASIDLSSITCDLSFKIHIKNSLDESHVATVKISIPLKDDVAGTSIYDGSFTKEITTVTNFSYEK